MSHYGVARDLRARLLHEGMKIELKTPSVSNFNVDKRTKNIKVNIEDESITKRYCGIIMENISVEDSPKWLQNRLTSIGITPINNIVDVTNFVMHDIGQPLHAFDYDKIEGNSINIKRNKKEITFTTLDEVERKLTKNDLIISDEKKPMCLAGIYGGIHSGVSNETSTIFLESAYFDPITVRKSAKHHNINTDSSYRFERGIDPNTTKYALKRAALLIKEICKGSLISSDVIDLYPKIEEDTQIILGFNKIEKTIGQKIEKEIIKKIITSLDIKINSITESNLGLSIPPFRNDVTREADVIEEILRIYGYNNIKSSSKINQSVRLEKVTLKEKLSNSVANHLVSLGFHEIMTNSLISNKENGLNKDELEYKNVDIINYSSIEQSQLRNSLIFSGLNAIKHNINRKNSDLKLFEFGKEYFLNKESYIENEKLVIFIHGNKNKNNWNSKEVKSDFYFLKGIVKSITDKIGFSNLKNKPISSNNIQEGESSFFNKSEIVKYGILNSTICNQLEIESSVYYAEFDMNNILKNSFNKPILYKKISKFPVVSRDLSILIDDNIKYEKIHNTVRQINMKLIKEVSLFDVYKGDKLPENKKSYGIAFKILDNEKTLSEEIIEELMDKITSKLKKEFKAELR
jgi:phenylalanyl-tRNA synthetase beta chain